MFTPKLLASLLLAAALLNSSIALAGGGSDGGGTSYEGHLLDSAVRKNTVSIFDSENTGTRANALQTLLGEALPDFADHYIDFFVDSGAKERFVLTDKMPATRVNDVKHSVGDHLVGIQRGPVVWVDRSFFQNASDDEKMDFFIHEFLVNQKLQQGPLSERDKDEVLNVSAYLSEQLRQALMGSGNKLDAHALQEMLEKNHFPAGLTNEEMKELARWSVKLNGALKGACDGKKPAPGSLQKLNVMFNWVSNTATDENASQSKRDFYTKISKRLASALGEKRDLKTICAKMRESELEDAFDDSITGKKTLPLQPSDLDSIESSGASGGASAK